MSKRGGSSGKGTSGTNRISNSLQRHFDKENKRIEEFMADKKQSSITMDNGQILEKYSQKEMNDLLKEVKRMVVSILMRLIQFCTKTEDMNTMARATILLR